MSGSFAVLTFGCRVNQADSLVIEADLRRRGAQPVPAEEADLVVVNTCSVTSAADQGARQTIRRLARVNPGVQVVVTGCYATRRGDDVAALPNVVRVVSNSDKDRLLSILDDQGITTATRFGEGDDACGGLPAPGNGGRTALTLRVQTGCEERCSYCIIPQTRGASRSLPMADVAARIRMAVTAGYKEVVITGVHLGSYGRDGNDGASLLTLLRLLDRWEDDVLFRVSSLEPMDCTPAIVDLIARSTRLAPHLHLPLQHTADRMLDAMRRPYHYADYSALIKHARAAMPHASIGSDVIVGFPGESDADFGELEGRLRELPLTHLHVFPYSDRTGTDATSLPDKVDGAVIKTRARTIREIGAAMTMAFRDSQQGVVARALTLDDGRWAVTPNYLKLTLDRQLRRNEWIDVKITNAHTLQATVIRGSTLPD